MTSKTEPRRLRNLRKPQWTPIDDSDLATAGSSLSRGKKLSPNPGSGSSVFSFQKERKVVMIVLENGEPTQVRKGVHKPRSTKRRKKHSKRRDRAVSAPSNTQIARHMLEDTVIPTVEQQGVNVGKAILKLVPSESEVRREKTVLVDRVPEKGTQRCRPHRNSATRKATGTVAPHKDTKNRHAVGTQDATTGRDPETKGHDCAHNIVPC